MLDHQELTLSKMKEVIRLKTELSYLDPCSPQTMSDEVELQLQAIKRKLQNILAWFEEFEE